MLFSFSSCILLNVLQQLKMGKKVLTAFVIFHGIFKFLACDEIFRSLVLHSAGLLVFHFML